MVNSKLFALIEILLLLLLISGIGWAVEDTGQPLSIMDKIKKYNLYHIMSTYTTYFNPEKTNRTQNIKVGAEKLDGKIIESGGVFSFNQTVGPRIKNRNFKEAPEIINGKIVDGIGGGVCQVSSTLYNAVLLADLEIIERVHHSQPVEYVSLGRGATVYYNQIDFKFENNLDSPVLIMARVKEDRLTISLLGRTNNLKVKIVTSKPEVLKPKVKKKIDRSLPPGQKKVITSGKQGYKVTVKKIVRKAGKIIKEEVVSQDIYAPKDRIIKINPE